MMTKTNDAFVSVKDLVVEYTAEGRVIHAVNGVSFDLERGKTLGLVGETGSGKSTIPKAMMRILPDVSARIKSGEVFLDGVNLLELSEKEMRRIRGRKISMIFQDPMTALNPIMRIGEQVAEVIKLHHDISWREARERAVKMLETVGIRRDRFNEYPHQFSGGMGQRVVIAMALACSPELLIADEPTSALDVTIQAQVLDMIARLKEEYNTSMIMISHNLGVVAEQCDDLAVIYAGQIVEFGSKEAIFDHPTHPYTLGLLASVPTLDDEKERLNRIPGLPPDPTNLPLGCHFGPRCPFANEKCSPEKIALVEVEPGHFFRCTKDPSLEARWPL